MEAVDEALDDRARQQFEIADARQDLRVDESCAGEGRLQHYLLLAGPHPRSVPSLTLRIVIRGDDLLSQHQVGPSHIPLLGTGTAESSSSIIESVVTPSDSARKFVS